MRLSEFIRANPESIERAWEDFARSLTPFATELSGSILRNDLRDILTTMAEDMESPQTAEEEQAKSKGRGPRGGALDLITTTHTRARLESGFNLEHAISEYGPCVRASCSCGSKARRREGISNSRRSPGLTKPSTRR